MKLALQRVTIVFLVVLTACAPPPELLATQTATASTAIAAQWTRTPTATVTLTPTSTLTHTPKPTATKTPMPTLVPLPQKKVLIELNSHWGDGPQIPVNPRYEGPLFILYADGELLKMFGGMDSWYSQTYLSTSQMCNLLSSIERTGFFKIQGNGSQHDKDPIYSFPNASDPRRSSAGAGGGWSVLVNGKPAKYVSVYGPFEDVLAFEIKSVKRLIENYVPPAPMKPYRAKYLQLTILKGKGYFELIRAPTAPLAWPKTYLRQKIFWMAMITKT